ncbi:MAG: hypothetical protein IH881_08280 [Myxococcales bacterium]|nr:hypothetical protein [Myxococcales bacterium]
MPQKKQPPIFSTLEDDLALGDAIDSFVISLAEEVDRLQDADLDEDLALLCELATKLRQRADELGYTPLAVVATVVADACRDDKLEDAQAAMVELTDISGRIRLGHRGAA